MCQDQLLKMITNGEEIAINGTDGTEGLAESTMFYIVDPDVVKWGLAVPAKLTKPTHVSVYELVLDASLKEIFDSFSPKKLSDLCLTQAQIVEFVRKHGSWLRGEEKATFFLTESEGKFYAIHMLAYFPGDRIRVRVYSIYKPKGKWYAENFHRVVVPI